MMNDLEEKILQIICEVYKKQYIGKLEVKKIRNGYSLYLYLDKEFAPLQMAADAETAEDFLEFVRKELVSRQLIKAKYLKPVKLNDIEGTCSKD